MTYYVYFCNFVKSRKIAHIIISWGLNPMKYCCSNRVLIFFDFWTLNKVVCRTQMFKYVLESVMKKKLKAYSHENSSVYCWKQELQLSVGCWVKLSSWTSEILEASNGFILHRSILGDEPGFRRVWSSVFQMWAWVQPVSGWTCSKFYIE